MYVAESSKKFWSLETFYSLGKFRWIRQVTINYGLINELLGGKGPLKLMKS